MPRPIRIANASGAIGDGLDQIYRLAQSDSIDAITADYLAEFNIAWKAIELQTRSDLGYETGFLEQLAWQKGEAAQLVARKGIKIVHDGGALNPAGLAQKVDEYFKSLGIQGVKIAWVEGDNVTSLAKENSLGTLYHLDRSGTELGDDRSKILSANVYTGMTGIVAALHAGAQIVICGRCTDASPVMGLATWWHGWSHSSYDLLAASLIAGHIIECGPYATGGNYCGWREVPVLHHVGYPIAEISWTGEVIITKPEGTNGVVTVDTCKSQLLYEIQGPYYLNPDVVARIDGAQLTQLSPNRVRVSGIRGSAPPPTSKLAICILGGWQAEISAYAAGLDTQEKLDIMKAQVRGCIDVEEFTTFSMETYGSAPPDPKRQQDCTVMMRIFAQAEKKETIHKFRRAVQYNGLQGYCGLHLGMDWRTMEPKPYVRYFPSLVPSENVQMTVYFVGDQRSGILIPKLQKQILAPAAPSQLSYNPTDPTPLSKFGSTIQAPLGNLVFTRSGDKGGNANIGFWVRSASSYPWLRSFLTTSTLISLLGDDWRPHYRVERCEFAGLWAVHFLIRGLLGEGVSSSAVLDGFGKSVGEFLRARVVDLPQELIDEEGKRRREGEERAGRERCKGRL
ncbi:hypothetical protein B0J11DRAFT_570278 [Dendryphion nanum]|uniref:DUF1446-domain-containing protein n=1 Tax=Dendryphion nanum TaxID=256645 RepID=A0A9P9DIZ3_9PLEO|nr:hypothetical protein B0J11DRAFT_570278 [Dendryphion nanum]